MRGMTTSEGDLSSAANEALRGIRSGSRWRASVRGAIDGYVLTVSANFAADRRRRRKAMLRDAEVATRGAAWVAIRATELAQDLIASELRL